MDLIFFLRRISEKLAGPYSAVAEGSRIRLAPERSSGEDEVKTGVGKRMSLESEAAASDLGFFFWDELPLQGLCGGERRQDVVRFLRCYCIG